MLSLHCQGQQHRVRSGLGEVAIPHRKLWGLKLAHSLSAGNDLSSEKAIVLFAAELPGKGEEKTPWLGMRKGVTAIPV